MVIQLVNSIKQMVLYANRLRMNSSASTRQTQHTNAHMKWINHEKTLLANNQFRSTNNRYLTKKSTCWQPMLTSLINLVSAAPVNPGVRPTSQSTTISHIIILTLFPRKSPHIFLKINNIGHYKRSALGNPLFKMCCFHMGIAQIPFDQPPHRALE